MLKTLGFTRQGVLALFVSESVVLTLIGGAIGIFLARGLVFAFAHAPQMTFFPLKMTIGIWVLALLISGLVGLVSAAVPSYHASQVNIVDGLRHIG